MHGIYNYINWGDLMRVILFLIGLLLSADGLYYGATTAMGAGEAIVVGIGLVFILWSVFYDAFREKRFLRFLKGVFIFFMTMLVVYSVAVCIVGKMDNETYREDYAIVLGAGLSGYEPAPALAARLDKAVEYLNKNSNATVIVSGGQGKGEIIPEAQAMQSYLVRHGINEGRIIMEERATSTYENFLYSKEAISDGSVVFITNDFHVIRSAQMAKLNGINATHMSAPTPVTMLPVSCAREAAAHIASVRYYFD